ncbi:MAG: HlyD family efflux transporter periplasmic adaptor subunit [Gemmatimonadota bacterium]
MDIARAPARNRKRWVYAAIGLVVVVAMTVALSKLEPAAPGVDGGALWRDTVRQGSMLREVRGPGTLVPEQIRWITAVTAGRVERVMVQPGATVDEATVLMVLTNPDVQIQTLDAERQLTAAEADLVNLKTNLESQRLNQASVVASVRSQYREAIRKSDGDAELARQGLISTNELKTSEDHAEEFTSRLHIEEQRLELLSSTVASQLEVQQRQVDRLRSIASFQREQELSMVVKAGAKGVLQELPLQVGQWANPGATLAKVVQPGNLKAVLRIPETQARDVAIGQTAAIDTRNGVVKGRVVRQDPASTNGTVAVDVTFEEPLPKGARPDLSVDGTIEIERLSNVLYVGRPAYGQSNSTVGIFRLDPGTNTASRVNVQLGRTSVNSVEVLKGLAVGDVVILSDMSRYDEVEKVKVE